MTLFNKREDLNFSEKDNESKNTGTIGSRISSLRKQHSYTQEEFATLLDVTPQAVSKWENDLACPDIMLLPKIAELLNTSVDELLTGSKTVYASYDVDISKLKLHIRITRNNDIKPISIDVPLTFVKRMAKLGNSISGVLGTQALNNNQLERILQLVDEGVTGEILNVVDENGQTVVIEIN